MATKVTNTYREQVHVKFMDQSGAVDGAHVQPGASVMLPNGASVTPNTMAEYPRLRLTETGPVEGPTAQPAVEDAPVMSKITSKG